ncbi:MAG TPA: hypothetical protein VG737_02905 [Cyclobacteriaceae bacterium]|nr:hypothetical protein [Cyclobacteriaceae bacterium]
MKKIYFILALAAITSVSLSGEAYPKSPKTLAGIAVIRSSATSYKLIYKSELQSDVKVEIYDSRNQVVFSEVIKMSDGFARPYNFGSLNDGKYTIRVDNGSNWLTETVQYEAGRIEKLAHLTTLDNGRYLLSVPGSRDQVLSVKIFEESGKLIYRKKQRVAGDFAQVYKLNDVAGTLLFEVTDEAGLVKSISR